MALVFGSRKAAGGVGGSAIVAVETLYDRLEISSKNSYGVSCAVDLANRWSCRARSLSSSTTWPRLPSCGCLVAKWSGVELVVGLLPNWHDLISTFWSSALAGNCFCRAQPCRPCQSWGSAWSSHGILVLHLRQGSNGHDFERACTWKLPSSRPGTKTTKLPTWSSLPPCLMGCGKLRKLFSLFRTFNTSSAVLPDRLNGLDQCRSRRWATSPAPKFWSTSSRSGCWNPWTGIPHDRRHCPQHLSKISNSRATQTAIGLNRHQPRIFAGPLSKCDLRTQSSELRPVADKHRNHDRQPRLALVHFSDQVLIHELLLTREVGVRSEPSDNPMIQDLVPIRSV